MFVGDEAEHFNCPKHEMNTGAAPAQYQNAGTATTHCPKYGTARCWAGENFDGRLMSCLLDESPFSCRGGINFKAATTLI